MKKVNNLKKWRKYLKNTLASIKTDSMTIASEMGIEPKRLASWKEVPAVFQEFSKKNSSPLQFYRNLDQATYEIREKVKWNTSIACHFTLEKVKQKPLLFPLLTMKKRRIKKSPC